MTQENIYVGLPTMCLLPLNKTRFKTIGSLNITITRRGVYNEIAPEIFDKDSGEFDLLTNDTIYLPSITKVLLAEKKYPSLKANQIFSPFGFVFDDETVSIEGMVLEILNVEQ